MTEPKPKSLNAVHISCGFSVSAILTMPTLLDFASTVFTSIVPRSCLSRMVLMPTRNGVASISVSAWKRPVFMPAATMNGLMLEPGSKKSLVARLR